MHIYTYFFLYFFISFFLNFFILQKSRFEIKCDIKKTKITKKIVLKPNKMSVNLI